MAQSMFNRYMHVEIARLEHERGVQVQSVLTKLVVEKQIEFLGNLPKVYTVSVVLIMLIWSVVAGFVFWADNDFHGSTHPMSNNSFTKYSMIDSVLMTTSAFTNSGLASAPLYSATIGGKILMIFAMFFGAEYTFEVLILYLYRRRLAYFINQHVESYEWADAAEDVHTEMRSTDVCILTVIAVNLCVLAAGFVSLGCYMHFYPGLATGNPSACFGHDCFFIAIFDAISAHTHSGHAIQTSGYATFVEHHFLMFVYIVLMLLGCEVFRKCLQNLCLSLLRLLGSLKMKVVVERTFSSVVLREVMCTHVPQLWWMLYTAVIILGSLVYFVFVEHAKSLSVITGSPHRSSQVIAMLFYAVSLRWTGTLIIDPTTLSSGALHFSLLSMFLPGNPFSRSIFTRSDTGERQKPHPFEFFKAPINTILVAVLVMGAIPHSSESGYTDYADPNNLRPDADKVYAEFFECVSAYFNCGQSLIYNSITSGVSYSFFLSHASKICIIACMVAGKMSRVFGLSSSLQFVCTEALLDVVKTYTGAEKDQTQTNEKCSPSAAVLSNSASSHNAFNIAPPSPSPTEPKVSVQAAQSELQVARHILHLKELLRVNQSQLTAGMGAAGLLKSGAQQNFSVSPSFNSLPVVPSTLFTPIAAGASRFGSNAQFAAPFTHDADGTRYSEEIIVSVPSRSNSAETLSNPGAASPTFAPYGYVRRQA